MPKSAKTGWQHRPASNSERTRDHVLQSALAQYLRGDLEAGGIDRHRLLVSLLHGLAEAVVWHELVTRKPLVCARVILPFLLFLKVIITACTLLI
jgi:hypothetical protein